MLYFACLCCISILLIVLSRFGSTYIIQQLEDVLLWSHFLIILRMEHWRFLGQFISYMLIAFLIKSKNITGVITVAIPQDFFSFIFLAGIHPCHYMPRETWLACSRFAVNIGYVCLLGPGWTFVCSHNFNSYMELIWWFLLTFSDEPEDIDMPKELHGLNQVISCYVFPFSWLYVALVYQFMLAMRSKHFRAYGLACFAKTCLLLMSA